MNLARTFALCFLLMAFSIQAQSKTASQVFEQASASVVVVQGLDAKGKQKSQGSGVVLPGGEVATNCHVIKEASQYRVKYLGKLHEARTRHTDWDRDVCTLTASGLKAPAVTLGSTKGLKVGAKVYAIGAPRGLELSLSEGIVSNLREVDGGRYIQTTAPISPGSSGGGLFDEEGRLLGLPTFYLAEGQQLNFAVPVEWVTELPKRSNQAAGEVQTLTQWINKGVELEARQDWPALIEHNTRWTRAQPKNALAWFSLGYASAGAGKTTKAIEAYQQALRINPEWAEAWYLLGLFYGVSGQTAKEIEAYQRALRIKEWAEPWYTLGLAYDKAGQTTKEIEAYQRALRINPEHAQAWYSLGVTHYDSGKTDKAIKAYEQALRIDPEYANAWFNLGVAFGASGKTAKAIEAYQQALRINPENAEAWYNLGASFADSSQSSKAIEAFKQSLRINPEDAEAWNNLGAAFADSSQSSKAIEAFKQALRINPEKAGAWYNLGVNYYNNGQRTQVIEVYRRLQTLDKALAEQFFTKIVMP